MAADAKRWKGRRGGVALTGKRDQYLRLMNQGISNSEACRRVGINRRTGTRWRYGRTVDLGDGHQLHYAAVVAPVVTSPRFLSEAERVVIADALRSGRSQTSIADELGRHRSTISREISRNRHPETGEYRPWAAQQAAVARRTRPKLRKLEASVELRDAVQAGLDQRWSPEQIERTLRLQHDGQPDMHVTAESIYQEIYSTGSVLRRDRPALRSGRVHRQRRRPQRRERFIAPACSPESRPIRPTQSDPTVDTSTIRTRQDHSRSIVGTGATPSRPRAGVRL